MRVVQPAQIKLGEIDVAKIWLDPKSRDDIPQILRGLQHISCSSNIHIARTRNIFY